MDYKERVFQRDPFLRQERENLRYTGPVDFEEVRNSLNLEYVRLNDRDGLIELYSVDVNKLEFRPHKDFSGLATQWLISGLKFAFSYWQLFCYISLAFYYIYNPGVISMFFPIIFFAYFIIVEGFITLRLWEILFLLITLVITFKFTLQLDGLHLIDQSGVNTPFEALFYGTESMFYEGFLFGIVFVQIQLLKKLGADKKYIIEAESIHQALLRVRNFQKPGPSAQAQPGRKEEERPKDLSRAAEEEAKAEFEGSIFDDVPGKKQPPGREDPSKKA